MPANERAVIDKKNEEKKERARVYQFMYYHRPGERERRRVAARNRLPGFLYSEEWKLEKRKQTRETPNGKLSILRRMCRRRLLGCDIINPELATDKNYQGHHIDREHILYIPTKIHRSVWHSLEDPRTMEQNNTKAYCWILGVF